MAEDSTEFNAQVQLEFTELDEMQKNLRTAITGALDGGLKMSANMLEKFALMKERAGELKKIMAEAENQADFKLAREAMLVLNKDATRLANQLLRTKGVPALDAAKIREAKVEMNQLARAQEHMSTATIKTSLASQNVIRIIQDAPFGMFGIANNIEQMSESIGRLIKDGHSLGGALKASFMPLVTGPMAIPFIISIMTALTLSWDKLGIQIDKARVALGLMTEAQAEFNKAKAAMEEGAIKDAINKIPWDELGLQIESSTEKLSEANAKLAKEQAEFVEKFGFTFDEAAKARAKVALEKQMGSGAGGLDAQMAVDALKITDETRKMAKAATEGEKAFNAIREEIKLIDDTIKRMEGKDQIEFMRQRLLASVGLPMFDDEDTDGKGGSKKQKDAETKRQQMIIDAMADGLNKRIAQIRLNGQIERKEIAKEFDNNAELIKLSLGKEKALIIKDRAEFVADMEKLAVGTRLSGTDKGFEREIAKIKADADERRKVVKNEFNGDLALLKLINDAEESALDAAREVRLQKLKDANDKILAEQAKARADAERVMKDSITEETRILVFGVQEQAMKVRAAIQGDDPFAAQEAEAEVRMNERLSLIRVRQMEISRLVDEGLMDRKLANAELARLGAEEIEIEKDTADAVKKIHEQKAAAIMGVSNQIFGNMSSFFGSMNTLAMKEGEKGLEETKKFLFAQAVAEAIAAGISAYQGWMAMKGIPMPLRIAAAASSMAMITARLMASAKQIKQVGKNSASGSAITGGFTQLNNAVTGQRISAFEKQQRTDQTRNANGQVVGAINDLGSRIEQRGGQQQQSGGVRIVYDDRTAGDILTKGTEFNQRHTSKISGATVGD